MAILNKIQFPGSAEVFEIADAQARAALEKKVDSVNGRTGAVTLSAENVGALPASGGTVSGDLTVGSAGSTDRAAASVRRLGTDGLERELTAFISSGDGGRIELRSDGSVKNFLYLDPAGTMLGAPLGVSSGGTGQKTLAGAKSALGISALEAQVKDVSSRTAADLGALPSQGVRLYESVNKIESFSGGKVDAATGEFHPSDEAGYGAWSTTNFIPVAAGEKYAYSDRGIQGNPGAAAFYDASMNFLSAANFASGVVTAPENAAYLRVSVNVALESIPARKAQVQSGAVATPFEDPGDTVTIPEGAVWHELVEVENRHGLFMGTKYRMNEAGVYTQYAAKIYDVRNCAAVRITGTSSGNADAFRFLDENREPIVHITVKNVAMNGLVMRTQGAAYLALSSKTSDFWGDSGLRAEGLSAVDENPWRGAKIVWFGTSIPQGGGRFSYPMQAGRILGADVRNESLGSSPIHARVLSRVSETNPYGFDANFERSSRALCNTQAQMQWIANWADYKVNGGTYKNAEAWDSTVFQYSVPASWTEADTEKLLAYSYEKKLDQYLTDSALPDAFVFNHGYNDVTSTSDDLGLYESMMDAEGRHNPFTFRGGMNFLIDRILAFNPRAKIFIIGEYDKTYPGKNTVYMYQQDVADEYQIPLLPMWEKLGLTQHALNLSGAWNNGSWQKTASAAEMTRMRAHLPDGVHPHSDKSGGMNSRIARIIAAWLAQQD